MKKKVKDLTSEEAMQICNNTSWCDCVCCPLFATNKCVEYSNERYEKEVEVDE